MSPQIEQAERLTSAEQESASPDPANGSLGRRSVKWRITIAASAIVSCLFVYPLIHELGHLVPAVVSGAEVNEFVWTPLIGPPHVSLNNVSGEAMPWVDAGGMLLPTLIGTILIGVWLWLPRSSPMPLSRYWLLIPGGVLLLGNLGIPFEMLLASNRLDHMAGLSQTIAGRGILGRLGELAPALWSLLITVIVIRRLCWTSRA